MGRVDWSVKSVFNGYLGFFDGNPSTLVPLPLQEKAEKMAALAGGFERLLEQATLAYSKQEYQWALELTDFFIKIRFGYRKSKRDTLQLFAKTRSAQFEPQCTPLLPYGSLRIKRNGN